MTVSQTSGEKTMARLRGAFARTPALFEVLRTVRSRRVGAGYRIDSGTVAPHPVTGRDVRIPAGPLPFVSTAPPVPLTELEEALLAWAACGPNGRALWDRSTVPGFEEPVSPVGRTAPHAGAAPAAALVIVNDEGAGVYRPAYEAGEPTGMAGDGADRHRPVLDMYREGVVRIHQGRPDIDHALGFPAGPAMGTYQHNINLPGTTWFIPVADCGDLGRTLLTSFGVFRAHPVDEFNGGRACGLDDLIDRGVLTRPLPISQLEMGVFQAEQYPVGCIVQNVRLAAEALGLGHWCLCGYSQEVLLGAAPGLTRGLGFHAEPPNPKAPVAAGALKVFGIRDVIESTYVPSPRHPTAEALVGQWWRERLGAGGPAAEPWVREACVRYIDYCVSTFGQWPVTYNPMQARFSVVVHHLDARFYDTHFPPGHLTELHRRHMRDWH